MEKYIKQNALASFGTAVGVGLIAGLAGTIAMTVCQIAEMKVTGRKPSSTPANAVREVLDVEPVTPGKVEKVSNEVHLAYGTSLGMIRGLIGLVGLKGMIANTLHFIIIWGGKIFMLPSLRVAAPITHESRKSITTDIVHHLVYVTTAGCVYDAINQKKKYSLSKEQRMAIKKIVQEGRNEKREK